MYEILEETQQEQEVSGGIDADYILLLSAGPNLFGKKTYDLNLLGASMQNWVARACAKKPAIAAEPDEDRLLQTIRPLLKDGEFTVVLFSDTPLVTAKGLSDTLERAARENLSVMRLARGWIFKTEYVKNIETIYASKTYDNISHELLVVDSIESLEKVQNVLRKRIIRFHEQAGAIVVDPASTYIEASVAIEPGAVIEPFVKLEGDTTIGANSKICSNSVISFSRIDEMVIVKNSCNIVGACVRDNAIVGNNCTILNKSVVGEETRIAAGSIFDGSTTNANCQIGEMCLLKNTKLANNVTLGDGVKCLGSELSDVKVGSGANVAEGCNLFAGVHIKQDSSVPAGTNVKG